GAALRAGIREVLGESTPFQTCRWHVQAVIDQRVKTKTERAQLAREFHEILANPDYAWTKEALMLMSDRVHSRHPQVAEVIVRNREELLVLHRFGVQAALGATFGYSNALERVFRHLHRLTRNVDRWRSDERRELWTAYGLLDWERCNTRRIPGHE